MTGVQTCALPIRSEEHTSELQSHDNLGCRLLLEKKPEAVRAVQPAKEADGARESGGAGPGPAPAHSVARRSPRPPSICGRAPAARCFFLITAAPPPFPLFPLPPPFPA